MTLFRRQDRTTPVDRVPEEDDTMVEVLRQAYASTHVPEDLVSRIQSAVAAAQQVERRSPANSRRLLIGGMIGAPAAAAAVIGLVLTGVIGGPGAKGTSAVATVVWSNAPQVSLRASATFLSPREVKVTYSTTDSGQLIYGRDAASGKQSIRLPHLAPVPIDNVTPAKILPRMQCPGSPTTMLQRTCFRVSPDSGMYRSGYVFISAPRRRLLKGEYFSSQNPVVLAPERKIGAPTHSRAPGHLRVLLPLTPSCPREDLCWLVKVQPVTAAGVSGSTPDQP